MLASVTAFLFVAAALFVLGAVVRFSVVSPLRTRGAEARLRSPEPSAVAGLVGFPLPTLLVEFYRTSPLVVESGLMVGTDRAETTCTIARFIPMTARDVREWRVISGVDGLPFAVDDDKGTFYLAPDGSVRWRRPDGEHQLADAFERFVSMVSRVQ